MITTCASTSVSASSLTRRRPLPSGRFLSTTRRSVGASASFLRASASETAGPAAKEFGQLSAEERVGALRLVFRQIEGAAAVALLSEDGAQIAAPVYLASPSEDPSLADRPVLGPADIEAFGRSIPLRAAVQVGKAVGPAHVSGAGDPRVAVAVRARGGAVLAVEFSLARLLPLV